MSQHKIKIKIDPMGTSTVEAEGFTGNQCAAATAGIIAALGGGGATDLKPEYYNEGDNTEQQHQSW
jgi:hypothetical protein